MVDYGTVYSLEKPQEKKIDDFSVWINSDIEEITVNYEGEEVKEYQFHQVRYTKDEYMKMLSDENDSLNGQINDLQMALCEIYEGGE